MMTRGIALMVVLATAHIADATNVIREWGGHSPAEYRIDTDPPFGDLGVRILANTQPELPWKFEAYDSVSGAPGDIDYIRIDPGVTVADLQLSVIGEPPLHEYGAENLDLLDLVEHGTCGNLIRWKW